MNKIIIFILFFSSFSFGQSKYLIYFKDKGFVAGKNSGVEILAYKNAKKILTEKALERRARMGLKKLIDYDDLPLAVNYLQQLSNAGIKIENKLRWFNAVSAYLTPRELERVQKFKFVKSIEPVRSVKILNPLSAEPRGELSKTSMYSLDYGPSLTQLELSDIPQLHDIGITGNGIRIGVLDSGFDWKNQKSTQNAKIIDEYDFVFKDNITSNEAEDNPSQHNHGTLVLSTIAGMDEGKLIGAAFDAEFVLAKTENISSETHAEEDNYAAALEWFEALGVDISTSSLGYSEFDPAENSYTYDDMNGKTTIVTRACEKAFQKGMITVTSAGNEGNNAWHYITAPGDGFNTITVGAVNYDNILASFSSRGPTADGRIKPDIVTMGVSVFAADARLNDYAYFSGTSLSAPIAAGICALVLSEFPYLTNKQLRQIILEAGGNVKSPDNERGYGLLSALRAVTFPHVKTEGNSKSIVKLFYDAKGINVNSVSINISDGKKEETFSVPLDNKNIGTFKIPQDYTNSDITFSYVYQDNSGQWKKNPSVATYNMKANSDLIKLYTGDKVIFQYLPEKYLVSNVYPNPFNGSIKLQYELPKDGNVTINIFDGLGRKVREFRFDNHPAGFYTKLFNLSGLASGAYLLNFRTNNFNETKKIILIK